MEPLNTQPELDGNETPIQLSASLELSAESAWRLGGGERYLANASSYNDDREPDMLPMHEAKIYWTKKPNGTQVGEIGEQQYLLPASAIKGAIRHRVAYHYNCLTSRFVDDDSAYESDESPAITALFGYAKDNESRAGILAFQDIYLETQKQQVLMHNKIDKFTGGVINGALFSENVLWHTSIKIKLDVVNPDKVTDPDIKLALHKSLTDLANGWLPLGASASRGLGVFLDKDNKGIQWSDNQTWIETRGAV